MKALDALEAEPAQIAEQLRAARDQEPKRDILASDSGHVHELVVHTEGGVIKPGEVLAISFRVTPGSSSTLRPRPSTATRSIPG